MLLRIPDSDSHFLIPLRILVSFSAFIFFSFAFNLEMQAKGIQSPDLWETSSEVTTRTPVFSSGGLSSSASGRRSSNIEAEAEEPRPRRVSNRQRRGGQEC